MDIIYVQSIISAVFVTLVVVLVCNICFSFNIRFALTETKDEINKLHTKIDCLIEELNKKEVY